MVQLGTVDINGKITHNTHRRKINRECFEYECLLAGEQLPKKWKNGKVVEWEFLETENEVTI